MFILNVYLETQCIDGWTISGGLNDTPAQFPPLFLGYYEESHYASPHYQSILPYKDSSVLRFIADNGGALSNLIHNGEFYSVLFCTIFRC